MKKTLFLALLGICLAAVLSACSSGISAMASATTASTKNQTVQSQSTEIRITTSADLLPETGKR